MYEIGRVAVKGIDERSENAQLVWQVIEMRLCLAAGYVGHVWIGAT